MLEVESSLSSSPVSTSSSSLQKNIKANVETRDALTEKIIELFHFCDVENKGYVVKADLYRLKDELGLDERDVDYAFDQLDTNQDSFLSMEEFTTGFGLFIGVQQSAPLPLQTAAKNVSPGDGGVGTAEENAPEIKIDFTFQVFNLIDKDDKGHISKQDLIEASDTLEIDPSQIDYLFSRLRTSTSEIIYFEDFVNNISSIVALSPALQEIKELEEKKEKTLQKYEIIARAFKMDLTGYEEDEIEQLLHEQATILFKRCDYGNKNFVTLDDLRTLASELDLSEEQVTEAFHRLNVNNKDYLTLREFVNGFGLFLGIEQERVTTEDDISTEELDKAIELFNACDINKRGYVSLYDLQQLTGKLGLSEQQITDIFKELDNDGNGFITLNEFINGFSSFTTSMNSFLSNQDNTEETNKKNRLKKERTFDEIYFMDSSSEPIDNREPERFPLERTESEQSRTSERNFISRQMSIRYESGIGEVDDMLDSIEHEFGSSISKDQLSELWSTVSSTGDALTAKKFENFLGKVYVELRSAKQEAKHLEDVLEKKSHTHTEEIKKIYDEMEIQIQTEKLRQKQQLAEKENMLREDLLRELQEKEKQIEKFMQRENALQNRLESIKEQETSLKHQNSKLQKENLVLEDRLNDSISNLEVLKSNLHHMEEQTTAEKKETLRAAVQATQGFASEHENLVKQLDLLRTMNHKLRDDRDSLESSLRSRMKDPDGFSEDVATEMSPKRPVARMGSNLGSYKDILARKSSTPTHSPLTKQGSVMSNYFDQDGPMHTSVFDTPDQQLSSIGETDITLEMEDPLESVDKVLDMNDNAKSTEECSEPEECPPLSPRHPPVGMSNEEERFSDNVSSVSQTLPPETPNRVYKIVFVGDSGVGKSSFIHRFCFDDFQKNFSATIGVDFQVKTIKVKNQWVALQLWDTAGQERFRSITKQYFRRADGVVIMFDVTSEDSFLNVKSWMFNVEEGAEPDCQIMLVGNKKDLCEKNPSKRKVSVEIAKKTAQMYNAVYEEVSALSGGGVLDSMNHIALRMAANEDGLLQKHNIGSNLNLHGINYGDDSADGGSRKKKCC